MKVLYTHYSAGAPIRERYQPGVDYLCHEFDLGFEDTLYLLKELKNYRSSLLIQVGYSHMRFDVESDNTLSVELDSYSNGLWAVAQITVDVAVETLRIAVDGDEFGEHIPTTDREWDAYTWT
ncbi:MAG TPA: hypothetical protein VGD61_06140 [Pyrinomonadaceae bacterium]